MGQELVVPMCSRNSSSRHYVSRQVLNVTSTIRLLMENALFALSAYYLQKLHLCRVPKIPKCPVVDLVPHLHILLPGRGLTRMAIS